MKRALFWLWMAACVVIVVLAWRMTDARAQTAQELIERQIGQISVMNAQCSANAAALQSEVNRLRKELDEARKGRASSADSPSASPGRSESAR